MTVAETNQFRHLMLELAVIIGSDENHTVVESVNFPEGHVIHYNDEPTFWWFIS
jgi:hypothetical protein